MNSPIIETELKEVLIKLDNKIDKLDSRLGAIETGQAKIEGRIDTLEEKFSGEIRNVKTDLSWIKWLLGILGSTIVLLLGIILTVTFKLLGN